MDETYRFPMSLNGETAIVSAAPDLRCDCMGFAWHGHCKHVAAVNHEAARTHLLLSRNAGSMLVEVD